MSRQAAAVLLFALLAGAASPAVAQRNSAAQAVEDARSAYGPQAPRPRCPTVREGEEIVVCAEEQEQSQFRIRSDRDAEDDYARETMNKGDPRAPDVAGPGIFRGPATMGFGGPPPPAYIIDFGDLPDTPPGSDAERVGKGLAPLGNEAANAPLPAAAASGGGTAAAARPGDDQVEPVTRPGSASPAEPR